MTEAKHSVATVCEAVWAAERELELFEWQVQGVRVWQGLRFESYLRLARATGVFGADALDDSVPRGAAAQARLARDLARGSVTHNPFLVRGKLDAILFEAARSASVDGKRVCVHSEPLARALTERGQRVMLMDQAQAGVHPKTPDPRRRYRDVIELAAALSMRVRPAQLTAADLARAEVLEQFFECRLGVKLGFAQRLRSYIPSFLTEHAMYRALFQLHEPRTIYCVVAYGRLMPMILAARELGIETIELQHGVISRYHLGYSYPVLPKSGRLAYTPDKLYAWGSPWAELMRAQLQPSIWNVVDYGFPHFDTRRARYAQGARVPGRVLVLSQTVLTERLAEAVLAALPLLADREIVYKLHPGEYALWKQCAPLVKLSQQPNVRIVTDADLYQHMAEAEVQVGVFSTALYEGLAFGCRTILVPLPGTEYMEELLEQGLATRWASFLAELQSSKGDAPHVDTRT